LTNRRLIPVTDNGRWEAVRRNKAVARGSYTMKGDKNGGKVIDLEGSGIEDGDRDNGET